MLPACSEHIKFAASPSGMFYECLLQFGDDMTHQIETASENRENLTQDQNGDIFQWAGLDFVSALGVSEQERERG